MRIWLVAFVLLLVVGCAQPGSNKLAMARWDYSPPLNGDGMHIALVNAAGEENTLQLYCHEPSKDLVLQIAPKDIDGDATDQSLTLAYDDGPPKLQNWRADMYQGRFFDFSLDREDSGFDAVVRDLKAHRIIEIVVSTAGKEVRRDKFSLKRAAEMIDRVLAICGHPIPA